MIKSFCVDFNWDDIGKFASPGLYAWASPSEHVRFYQEMGANVIQTFAVSHNGYAWYPSEKAPAQPGLKTDFLGELTELGHEAGLRVFGYFSPGANPEWGERNKEEALSRTHNTWHVPFTTRYLDYLCSIVEECLRKNPVDGLMLDWLWAVTPTWNAAETALYKELFGEDLPPPNERTEELATRYQVASAYRAWQRIRETAKAVRDDIILWISCVDIDDPLMRDTPIARETDWLMNEHPDTSKLEQVIARKGADTTAIQCLCGWGDQHRPEDFLNTSPDHDIGLYGFAKAEVVTTLPDPNIKGNLRNIETIRSAYRS